MEDYKTDSDNLTNNEFIFNNNNNNNNQLSLTSLNSLNKSRFMIQSCKSNVNNYFLSFLDIIYKHLESIKYNIKLDDLSCEPLKLFINSCDEYITGIMMDNSEVIFHNEFGLLIPIPFTLRAKWISNGKIKEDNYAHEIRSSDEERQEAICNILDYDRHQLGAKEWCIFKFYKYADILSDCYPYFKSVWMDGEEIDIKVVDKLIRKSRVTGEIMIHLSLQSILNLVNSQCNEIYLTTEIARCVLDGDTEPIDVEVRLYIDNFINLSISDSLLLDTLLYLISSELFDKILDCIMEVDYNDYIFLKELQIGIYNEAIRYCDKKSI